MHPMHMHLVMFQVVNRQTYTYDGSTVTPTGEPIPPEPTEAGWKDTARAEPGLITCVIAASSSSRPSKPGSVVTRADRSRIPPRRVEVR